MGTYVNNGKVTLGDQYNYSVAASEIASLVGVGRRNDGKLYLADICMGDKINMWARHKPEDINIPANITDTDRKDNGYSISINLDDYSNSQKPLQYISGVNYVKPSTYKRLRDFDGYYHTAKSPFEWKYPTFDGSSWVIPNLVNNDTNSVPLSAITLQKMLQKGGESTDLTFDNLGYVFVTYSGFFKNDTAITSINRIDDLISELRNNTTGNFLKLNPNIGTEPKGREGHFIFYRKKENNYYQLLPSIIGKRAGNIHPIEIVGWNPNMVIRTLNNGINNGYLIKDFLNNNTILDFCKDDVLFFNFSIKNNSGTLANAGNVKLYITVSYLDYVRKMNTILYDTENSLETLPTWSVPMLTEKGPYNHTGKYGLSTLIKFPRYAISPYSIVSALEITENIKIPSGIKFNITFSIRYYKTGTSSLDEDYLVSSFTLPVRWSNTTINEDLIPDFVKPVPPDWNIELEI